MGPLRDAGFGTVGDKGVVGVDVGDEVVEGGAGVGEGAGCGEGLGVGGKGEECAAGGWKVSREAEGGGSD